MKIQYNNSLEARIAYIECQTNTLPFVDFSEFADDPDFHIYPVFGDKMTNTLYTNRDFMEKANSTSAPGHCHQSRQEHEHKDSVLH